MAPAPFPSMTDTYHITAYPSILPTRPEQSAAGKTIVITGGGAGIGAAIAVDFAIAGAKTIGIVGRTQSTLTETASRIEAANKNVKVLTSTADILDPAALEKAFSGFKAASGPIDIFVNNAAYFPENIGIKDAEVNEWWKGYEINVKGSFNVIKAFLPNVAPSATIINVTTGGIHIPYIPGMSSYAPSKLAASKVFEYLQGEYPELRVHQFHPGVIMTTMGQKSVDAGVILPLDDSESYARFSLKCLRMLLMSSSFSPIRLRYLAREP
jgi:NAD(P)-dependent dehydrogenase (short-subunit alcohol dehydrogenase family)